MTPTPHDALFKAIYSDPQRAAAHLAVALPEEVAAALDLGTLSLAPGSYIDPELTASASDLLFEVRTRGGRAALVYLLFEHQSRVDRMMALRLLCYIVRIMERWRLDHPNAASLPLVVPLVLYHGERPWSAPLDLAELYDLGERDSDALQGHGVGLRYRVRDLSAQRDEELRARARDALDLLVQLLLKHCREEDLFEQL